MKILLVTVPPSPESFDANAIILLEPLALEYIGAAVQENHEVRLLDLRVKTEPELKTVLESFQPDILGCGPYTHEVYPAKAICAEAKKRCPGILTVVGGHHATVMPEDLFDEHIDVIVTGEGVHPFRKICDFHETKKSFADIENIYYRSGSKMVFSFEKEHPPLDSLPLPDRSLTSHLRHRFQTYLIFNKPMGVATIRGSVGCFYRCNFCAISGVLKRKVYRHSPQRLVKKLATIKEPLVLWVDDEFLLEPQHALLLAREIEKAGIKKYHFFQGRSDTIIKNPGCIEAWAKIGLTCVFVGMEAHREKYLKQMKKGTSLSRNEDAIRICHDHGVKVRGGFIVQPDFNKKDFRTLGRYIRKSRVDIPNITVLTPFPGTDLYSEKKKELLTTNYNLFDMTHTLLPTKLPLKHFYKEYARLSIKKVMSFKRKLEVLKVLKNLDPKVRKELIANSRTLYRKMKNAYKSYEKNLW